MNVALTNECSRRCEYCFQKEWFLTNKDRKREEMSLDLLETVLMMSNGEHIKLMGGEPLMYTQLDDAMKLIMEYEMYITFISNLTVDTEIVDNVIENYKIPVKGWLVNTDYTKTQKDLFLKNLMKVRENFDGISLSSTLLPDENKIVESAKRLNEILSMDERFTEIRISPMTPNHEDGYGKYDFTESILEFISMIREKHSNVGIHFDCCVPPCELNWDKFKVLKNVAKHRDECTSPALDFMPDKSAIWCSSAKDIRIEDFTKYKDVKSVIRAFYMMRLKYYKNNSLKCDYKNCDYFIKKRCHGACMGRNLFL